MNKSEVLTKKTNAYMKQFQEIKGKKIILTTLSATAMFSLPLLNLIDSTLFSGPNVVVIECLIFSAVAPIIAAMDVKLEKMQHQMSILEKPMNKKFNNNFGKTNNYPECGKQLIK